MINYIKNTSNLPDLSTLIYFTILAVFSYDSPGGSLFSNWMVGHRRGLNILAPHHLPPAT